MTRAQLQGSNARTVLVIEDDEDTRQFVEDLLIMSGYAVLGAATGQAALTHVAAQRIDVILLDRRLPDADGVMLCPRLREHIDGVVPIILVTADRSPGLEAAARAAGATDFLLKPYLPADLLGRLPPPT
jgi:DNA-binding response OmpR family regulator